MEKRNIITSTPIVHEKTVNLIDNQTFRKTDRKTTDQDNNIFTATSQL